MIKHSSDDNSEVLESPKAPAEALRQQIHEAVAETIQIERIGRATDPKPADRIWFTTQMQDMFVLSTDYLETRLLELVTAYAATVEREALQSHRRAVTALKGRETDLTADMNRALDWVLEDIDARLAALQGPIQGDAPDQSETAGS